MRLSLAVMAVLAMAACKKKETPASAPTKAAPVIERAEVTCPPGAERREGVPGGRRNYPSMEPVWAVVCIGSDGRRVGDVVGWYPNGTVRVRGSYVAGSRDGRWEYFEEDGSLYSFETWAQGIKVGEQQPTPYLRGMIVDRRREGAFLIGGFREARFSRGLPVGSWVTEDGSEVRPGGDASGPVELVVAGRELRAGEPIAAEDLVPRRFHGAFSDKLFAAAAHSRYLIEARPLLTIPAGAPLMWSDVEVIVEPPTPEPLDARAAPSARADDR